MVDGDDDRGIAASLADGVVLLGPDGRIAWANTAFARLIGRSIGDLVGTDGFSLLHPDEQGRALDGIVYASQFPERTSVAPYRILHGSGDWLRVELKSGLMDRNGESHIVLVVRDGSNRSNLNRALQSMANGLSLERTASLLAEAITARWPFTGVAIAYTEPSGRREVVHSGVADEVARHAAQLAPDTEIGRVTVVDKTELDEELVAAAAGFEGFAAVSVDDPVGQSAVLVVWFDQTVVARLEFTHAAAELTEVLELALERRHRLWQLQYVAHHDSLTGLLNRAGFLARFAEESAAARSRDGATMSVLYLDLDALKRANDEGGHAAGDRVLIEVARRLRDVAGPALVGRLGGDEFVVAHTGGADDADQVAEALADQLVGALCFPVPPAGDGSVATPVTVAVSIGIAADDRTSPPMHVIERADAAMYRAKAGGKCRWSR